MFYFTLLAYGHMLSNRRNERRIFNGPLAAINERVDNMSKSITLGHTATNEPITITPRRKLINVRRETSDPQSRLIGDDPIHVGHVWRQFANTQCGDIPCTFCGTLVTAHKIDELDDPSYRSGWVVGDSVACSDCVA